MPAGLGSFRVTRQAKHASSQQVQATETDVLVEGKQIFSLEACWPILDLPVYTACSSQEAHSAHFSLWFIAIVALSVLASLEVSGSDSFTLGQLSLVPPLLPLFPPLTSP